MRYIMLNTNLYAIYIIIFRACIYWSRYLNDFVELENEF